MSTSHPVTELVLAHLKPGISLDHAAAGTESTGAQDFGKLCATLKTRKGFIRQFWGLQVENPNIVVWSIDWESFEDHAAFINSDDYKPFIAQASLVFDFEAAAPLILHTRFTSDVVAAREAPVTELAFFMLEKSADEKEKTALEDAAMPLLKFTTEQGTCSAFAVGWVFETMPHPDASSGQAVAFQALLGWPSVEDHLSLRKTTEFGEVAGAIRKMGMPPVEGRSMFHARFQTVP